MVELLSSSLAELLTLFATLLGSAVVTLAGFGFEYAGLLHVVAGETTIGVWEVAAGGLALYVGVYLLGYQTALPQLLERRQTGA